MSPGPLDVPGIAGEGHPFALQLTSRQLGDGRPLHDQTWALAGARIIPRQWAAWCYARGYRYTNLVKRVATDIGESQLRVGAYHYNVALLPDLKAGQVVCNVETLERTTIIDPAKGTVKLSGGDIVSEPLTTLWVVSEDCGPEQIDIAASQIGTLAESSLRTEDLDPKKYEPVALHNLDVGWQLYEARGFGPWVAFDSGWATFAEWWVWHQVAGVPTGPWLPTGRFVQQAIRAVANFHLLVAHDLDRDAALKLARERQTQFKVKGTLGYSDDHPEFGIYWTAWPPKPAEPPADGVGPRPVPITV